MGNRLSRLASLLMTLLLVAVAALVALNWVALNVVVPVNVGAMQVDLPMGAAAVWGLALVALLFMAAQLGLVLGAWRRTRLAEHEINRLRTLAEAAETSRFEALSQSIQVEFRRLHARLGPEQVSELVVDEPFAAAVTPTRSGFFSKRTGT